METFADRAQRWLGHHLARAPEWVVRRTTGRRPISIDGQRLDLHTQHALAVIAAARRPPLDQLPVAAARREYQRFPRVFEDPPRPMARIETRAIEGPRGDLPVRIYRTTSARGRSPALVYFHGGGGVIGSIETHDGLCRLLAEALECVVISVDYGLGPEHPFPAGIDDALAAFDWVRQQAEVLGLDPGRIAVGGDSMGGNFSAVVCQQRRDADQPVPCAQLLLYPATDRVAHLRSRELFGQGLLLTETLLRWFMQHYLHGADPHDPRVSPLRHHDLHGLPPAVLVTAGFDPLRDEGQAYAEALARAGVRVASRCQDGLVHGFAQMTGAVPAARRAVLDAAAELRAIFDRAC